MTRTSENSLLVAAEVPVARCGGSHRSSRSLSPPPPRLTGETAGAALKSQSAGEAPDCAESGMPQLRKQLNSRSSHQLQTSLSVLSGSLFGGVRPSLHPLHLEESKRGKRSRIGQLRKKMQLCVFPPLPGLALTPGRKRLSLQSRPTAAFCRWVHACP